MPKIAPFEKHTIKYEEWFERNEWVYQSELRAIEEHIPEKGKGVEIGVGSGRFAAPLGIQIGVEPSIKMVELARNRGIETVCGTAEKLPLGDARFDFALMVTTICFLDDIKAAFKEICRVLKSYGSLIIGFVDKDSLIGKTYLKHKNESVFYQIATFYSVNEVVSHLTETGFKNCNFTQTIFKPLIEIRDFEPIEEGYGTGSFVVIRAIK